MNPLELLICINVILGIGIIWTPYGSVKSKCAEVTPDPITKYWFLNYVSPSGLCTLCGNTGKIDTVGITSAAGVLCGRINLCLCPNGQKMRELGAKP